MIFKILWYLEEKKPPEGLAPSTSIRSFGPADGLHRATSFDIKLLPQWLLCYGGI